MQTKLVKALKDVTLYQDRKSFTLTKGKDYKVIIHDDNSMLNTNEGAIRIDHNIESQLEKRVEFHKSYELAERLKTIAIQKIEVNYKEITEKIIERMEEEAFNGMRKVHFKSTEKGFSFLAHPKFVIMLMADDRFNGIRFDLKSGGERNDVVYKTIYALEMEW